VPKSISRAGGVALVAMLVAGTATGCGGNSSNTSGSLGNGTSFVAGDGVATLIPAGQRKQPVELTADTLEGKRFDLATLRGKPVVLNVWGSWCSPCREEAPALQSAATQLAGSASFIGINTRDDVGQALAFDRRFKITYPSVVDRGTLLLALAGAVPPQAIPTTLVLDAKGRVAARFSGPVTRLTLVGMVQDVSKAS
jgi:thiol-disulfide isomerase/thioredoxin